jgi:YVTN family beta-propeller protein
MSVHRKIRPLVIGILLLGALAAWAIPAVRHTGLWSRMSSLVRLGKQNDGSVLIATQQILKPWTPEHYIKGRPVDMAYNADKSKLAILNMNGIEVVDEPTGQTLEIKTQSTSYCGIGFRPGKKELWASEADENGNGDIYIAEFEDKDQIARSRRITLPGNTFPTGFAFSKDGEYAYIALNSRNTIAVVTADSGKTIKEIPVGLAPLFVTISPEGDRLYVSNRGGDKPRSGNAVGYSAGTAMATDRVTGAVLQGTVSVIDLKDPANSAKELAVGRAPTYLALSPDGKTLAVTNSHSDSVSLIDTVSLSVSNVPIPTLPDGLLGTAPVGAVFSTDGESLYVAAALNNAVTVLKKSSKGYAVVGAIPTGWFPTALTIDSHGSIMVLNIKGDGNTDNGKGTFNTHSYEGSLMRIPPLSSAELTQATQLVVDANNLYFSPSGEITDLTKLGIRHVILLIKENRTYDQVFGDLKQGNGDPKLVMYGESVTPNHHALAQQYVLLDNFYATGAISFDGHQWLEQGFVSDATERGLTSHPRGYAWDLSDALEVSPGGFIWQHSRRPLDVSVGGILSLPAEVDPKTQRTKDITEGQLRSWSEYWQAYQSGGWTNLAVSRPAVPALAGVMDTSYPVNAVKMTDQIRASLLEKKITEAEKSGTFPDFLVYGLTSDHTMGKTPGTPTPRAMVADNDLAIGRIVEAVSKSKFWPSTLILIVEDDAQNGVDHVDGHRTVALAIGPSVARKRVDSNFYTQLSLVRTIQDILGIDPQTHFLKTARPMNSIFTAHKDLTPYHAITPSVKLDELNPPLSTLNGKDRAAAQASARMNWNHVDDVPTSQLNAILWRDAKGNDIPMPPTMHSLPSGIR